MTPQQLAHDLNQSLPIWAQLPEGIEDRRATEMLARARKSYPTEAARIEWAPRSLYRDGVKLVNPDHGFVVWRQP